MQVHHVVEMTKKTLVCLLHLSFRADLEKL